MSEPIRELSYGGSPKSGIKKKYTLNKIGFFFSEAGSGRQDPLWVYLEDPSMPDDAAFLHQAWALFLQALGAHSPLTRLADPTEIEEKSGGRIIRQRKKIVDNDFDEEREAKAILAGAGSGSILNAANVLMNKRPTPSVESEAAFAEKAKEAATLRVKKRKVLFAANSADVSGGIDGEALPVHAAEAAKASAKKDKGTKACTCDKVCFGHRCLCYCHETEPDHPRCKFVSSEAGTDKLASKEVDREEEVDRLKPKFNLKVKIPKPTPTPTNTPLKPRKKIVSKTNSPIPWCMPCGNAKTQCECVKPKSLRDELDAEFTLGDPRFPESSPPRPKTTNVVGPNKSVRVYEPVMDLVADEEGDTEPEPEPEPESEPANQLALEEPFEEGEQPASPSAVRHFIELD